MSSTRAVVFDLDGTLVDSAPDIAHALTTALYPHRLGPISTEQVRGLLGGGATTLVRAALEVVGGTADLTDTVLGAYTEAYRAEPARETTVHADAAEALRRLRRRGVATGVCTNKRTELSRQVLAGTGLAPLIDVVVGIDAVPAPKPDPGHLLAVLTALDVPATDTVYVGDTDIDELTARRAGVRYRQVSWGHPLPDAVTISTFSPLLDDLADPKERHATGQ